MKKQLVTLFTLLSLSPLASFALNASQPPACPAAASLKNIPFVYAEPHDKLGWSALTNTIDDTFIGALVDIYEPAVTNKSQAITQAATMVQPATMAIENKFYFGDDHSGKYLWICYYDMPASSLDLGDTIFAISKEYNANGTLAATQHTLSQKITLIRNAK
jgi:hypothetical protein